MIVYDKVPYLFENIFWSSNVFLLKVYSFQSHNQTDSIEANMLKNNAKMLKFYYFIL